MAEEFIERGALIARYDAEHVGPPGRARELMATAPAADVVEVLHGRWESTGALVGLMNFEYFYRCTACGRRGGDTKTNYCPHCGAKMDKEEVCKKNT